MSEPRFGLDQFITIKNLARNWSPIINNMIEDGRPRVVTKRNEPVAVMMSVDEYKRLHALCQGEDHASE